MVGTAVLALSAIALAAAVAGGNLAVTTSPRHPVAGSQARVLCHRAAANAGGLATTCTAAPPGKSCAAAAAGERRRGRLLRPPLDVDGAFDAHASSSPARPAGSGSAPTSTRSLATRPGQNCGPAIGLPPDAGFSQIRVKVRPAARALSASGSHSVNSPAGSGRVIT